MANKAKRTKDDARLAELLQISDEVKSNDDSEVILLINNEITAEKARENHLIEIENPSNSKLLLKELISSEVSLVEEKEALNAPNVLKNYSYLGKYLKFNDKLNLKVPSDNQNILKDPQDCLQILETLYPLGRIILGLEFDVEKEHYIGDRVQWYKSSENNISREGVLIEIKYKTLYLITKTARLINEFLIKPQFTLEEFKNLTKTTSIKDKLNLVTEINLTDLTDILDGITRIFPDIILTLPKKVYDSIALINDLNYMVGGSAITSGCKALRDPKKWTENELGEASYRHNKADKSNSSIVHNINDWTNGNEIKLMPYSETEQILEKFGVYPALLHLILAVHFYRQDDPLSANLRLKGTDLIKDLGLDKRTDLTKEEKLNRVLETVTAVRSLVITAKWTSIIKVQKGKKLVDTEVYFEVMPSIMWDLSPIKVTEKDLFGNEELIDLDIRVKAGAWLGHFFNKSGREIGKALYNFATLSQKILDLDPYHEELALRIALLQSTMDYRQYYTVEQWLIENLPGAKDKINKAKTDRNVRRYLTNLWDNTLIALERVGFTISYHDKTYPENLRPDSPKKPYKYFDSLLMAKVRLTPETLGKPQPVIDVKTEEIKPVKQITEKVYSGADLKKARLEANITPKQIAQYLKCKSLGKIYNAEKRDNLSKALYKEILDAINYIKQHPAEYPKY